MLLLMVVVVQGKEVTSTLGRDLTSCFPIPFSAATTITLAIANQKLWWCDEENGGTDGLRFADVAAVLNVYVRRTVVIL